MRLQGVFFTPEECDTLWNLQQGRRWYVSNEFGTYIIEPNDPEENWKQAPEYLDFLKQKESGIPLPMAAGRLRSECRVDMLKVVDDENSRCFSDIILRLKSFTGLKLTSMAVQTFKIQPVTF